MTLYQCQNSWHMFDVT